MTNEELIATIRNEIERRIKECEATYPKDKGGYWFPEQEGAYAIAEEYKQLLSFLSTLESEKPMNPEELEEEMDRYFETMPVLEHENIFEDTFKNIARHFAKWGADHFRDTTKMVETPVSDDLEEAAKKYVKDIPTFKDSCLMKAAFEDGWLCYQEQMMKEAVEGEIHGDIRNQEEKPYQIWAESDFLPLGEKFEIGDKVRIIIVKED